MKKCLPIVAVVLLFALLYSCTKDKAKSPVPVSCIGISPDSLLYSTKIGRILDDNCAYSGCHSQVWAPSSANVDLEGYAAAKNEFLNDSIRTFCAINQGIGCVAMPQALPKLADSLLNYLECWVYNGCPQ